MKIDKTLKPKSLSKAIERVFDIAATKTKKLDKSWDRANGTPVFTVGGKYTTRGWTEWTQGFQYGCLILAGDATADDKLIELGKERTMDLMLPHVTHIGVHDHGFNNLSTYGNLLRLMHEGRIDKNPWEQKAYEDAIAASGAVQAARWSGTPPVKSKHTANAPALGYVYSFNGPHSLFIDTMRTIRIMGVAWQLGHVLMHEGDRAANLLKRSILHGLTTSHYIVFHGDSEHTYDVRGRTAHEGMFNRNDGAFRARSTQQGYSPFSTWTRGLAWAVCGYAEELEFLDTISASDFKAAVGMNKSDVVKVYERCAKDTCDHFIDDVTASDGITYWDDGAPNLHKLGDWQKSPADPYNDFEPVDSTASAIAAQGLIRYGNYLNGKSQSKGKGKNKSAGKGDKYIHAGLTTAKALFDEPYLSTKKSHQGLLLHSIYHWPNHWDHVPEGSKVANGESSMWGDYHLLELANLVKRMAERGRYPTFYL